MKEKATEVEMLVHRPGNFRDDSEEKQTESGITDYLWLFSIKGDLTKSSIYSFLENDMIHMVIADTFTGAYNLMRLMCKDFEVLAFMPIVVGWTIVADHIFYFKNLESLEGIDYREKRKNIHMNMARYAKALAGSKKALGKEIAINNVFLSKKIKSVKYLLKDKYYDQRTKEYMEKITKQKLRKRMQSLFERKISQKGK